MKSPTLALDINKYFDDVVEEAFFQRRMHTLPTAKLYLVNLLSKFITTDNLFEDQDGKKTNPTVAELFLKAQNASDSHTRIELYKKIGDVSLYVGGLFSDSLARKLVDVDYYAEMGGSAYGHLGEQLRDSNSKELFREYSARFLEFMDVLTLIGQRVFLHDNESLLRLYDRYLKTGSPLARETLLEKGIASTALDKDKKPFEQ